MVRPSNKNAHVGAVSEIVTGTMFKANKAWYLAAQKPKAEPDMAAVDWSVMAYTKQGRLTWVPIYGEEVELPDEGYIPPCFRSSTVLREVTMVEAQITGLQATRDSMVRFAAALKRVGC